MKDYLSKLNSDYGKDSEIKWNFTELVINCNGEVVVRFEPTRDMTDVEVRVKSFLQLKIVNGQRRLIGSWASLVVNKQLTPSMGKRRWFVL